MANYEVVISGVAGAFPECTDVKQLEQSLFTNENLVKETDSNWKFGNVNMAPYLGRLKNTYYFDQTFFGIHGKLCQVMDVHARHSLEKTFEALCDAGINPQDIAGTNTAVIMATMTSETEYGSVVMSKNSGHAMVGHGRCMQSNRISYFFNLTGPSVVLNATWTAAIQALEIGANLVSKGQVKMAIIGATNILFFPELSVNFHTLGKLNSDGKTKSFSGDADGYNRSEGVAVFIIQRAEGALRSYGTIIKVRAATEMNHNYCYVDPTGYECFLNDFYRDININYADFGYIEGDGCASMRTDAMELNSLASVICSKRSEPLYVGSCKSKLGHSESASPFASILNALIAFKTGYIPPNLHYSKPNPLVPALKNGKLKVVTEKTPLQGDLIAVSNIGLGSTYGHVLLRKHPKTSPIKEANYFPPDGMPRLFLISGRDESRMTEILKEVVNKPIDENFYALDHNLYRSSFQKHLYRGYSVVSKQGKICKVNPFSGATDPVWFVFSGMGSQWPLMGLGLMEIPNVRRAIEKCHNVLKPKGIDLISIITCPDASIYDDILNAFVGIAAIQIGLVDLLEEIGVKADGIVGHSVGELGCSYADKCLTAEQVILAAYARGRASKEASLIKGMMAAVGKGYQDIKDELPDGIEVACHNSKTSCTLSGPVEIMEKYVDNLKQRNIFAKLVNVANIAYHSKNIAPAAPYLLKYLKEIIPEPKLRSNKWISSSCTEDRWDTDLAKYCSAEYHTNNLLSYVLFEEATQHIPKNAICIEIAPHGLLQAIIKKSLSTCCHIPLTNRFKGEGSHFLFEALGNLFTAGVELDLTKLYPAVKYPVPRETDFLSVVSWSHVEPWIPLAVQFVDIGTSEEGTYYKHVTFDVTEGNDLDLTINHCVRGNTVYPKSKIVEYLMRFLKERSIKYSFKIKCFAFQDVKFHEDLPFDVREDVNVAVLFQMGSGRFEATFKSKTITTGYLNHMVTPLPSACLDSEFTLKQQNKTFISEDQIYNYFEGNGCTYSGPFRSIKGFTMFDEGFTAKIIWNGNSEIYIDSLFKLLIFYSSLKKDMLVDIDNIYQFLYDPSILPEIETEIDVYYDNNIACLCSFGVRILYYTTKAVPFSFNEQADLTNLQFVPYSKVDSKTDFSELCLQIIRENSASGRLNLQVIVDESSPVCISLVKSLTENIRSSNNKIYLRSRNAVSNIAKDANTNDCYLIVTENRHSNDINELLKSGQMFYLILTGSVANLQKKVSLNELTPIIEQSINTHHVVFYKKKRPNVADLEFVEMPGDDFIKEIETLEMDDKKRYFLLYKYSMLSEIIDVLQLPLEYSTKQRFIFIDDSSPLFNPGNSVYNNQIVKDLKVNIVYKGAWGSLRRKKLRTMCEVSLDKMTLYVSLNRIRCSEVGLEVVAVNLKNPVFPEKNKQLSVFEYSGIKEGKRVFGLGRLTEGNYLNVDPLLSWSTPKRWTHEEAVSVPLSYSMAYHLLVLKGKSSHRPCDSILIHAGHSPFGQAVLHVALEQNMNVFTTCFTERQRVFILNRFSKIDVNKIYIINGESQNVFQHSIMSSTNGLGVDIVIDPFEDNSLKTASLHCAGERGSYYLLTNDKMNADFCFGMNVFLTQAALFGYNPEFLFDMSKEEKLSLRKHILNGIELKSVIPLETSIINGNISNEEVEHAVLHESKKEFPKKIIIPIAKTQNTTFKDSLEKKKVFMIVGTYNYLWFDLLKWLVSKGAETIHVVINKNEIPQYLQQRFDRFLAKRQYLSIQFTKIDNINSAQMCNNFIKNVQNGHQLETLYYIKPGFEKQLINIDYALRTHSKDSCLAVVGHNACRITEKRQTDGYKGVLFMLAKNNLKNNTIINAFETWYSNCSGNEYVILIDKVKETKQLSHRCADVLPNNSIELVDLLKNISEKPRFIEVGTRCVISQHAKDLNPIFIFPGMKFDLIEKMSKKLLFPAYMAQYPEFISSLEETANLFCKELITQFNLEMFTLIAEGWSGPLVITLANALEKRGIISEVILLDASPDTIRQWNINIETNNNIISKYLPNDIEDENVTANTVKRWSSKMSEIILNEERGDHTKSEIDLGLKLLTNRLNVLQDYSVKHLESTVHLFTPSNLEDVINLKMMTSSFYHHVYKSPGVFLENPNLIEDINSLPLVQHRMCARKQVVNEMATFNLIGEEGINRPFNLREATQICKPDE